VSVVGRESKAHPAFCLILTPDAERYRLPPIPGYNAISQSIGGIGVSPVQAQAEQAVAQIGLGLVFFMAKIMLRSGNKLNNCW